MAEQRTSVSIEGRTLTLSNLDKVLYPSTGFTKGQLIDYYARIAPAILEHLRARPLTLIRYPNGVESGHFYEKRCPPHAPEWVTTADVPSGRKGTVTHVVCDCLPTLVWLANLAAIELHPLLARAPQLDHPSVVMFDLDPGPPADILTAGRLALVMREVLVSAGFDVFVKTSGSKGLHLACPLDGTISYEHSRLFARTMAERFEKALPSGVISVQTKTERTGKILIDWNQNGFTNTTACVYSLRARAEPSVSTPIAWDELARAVAANDAESLRFGPEAVLERVGRNGDLWAGVVRTGAPSAPAMSTALQIPLD